MNWTILNGMMRILEKIAFFVVITVVVALAALLFATVAFGEITGQDTVEPGRLVVFESTIEGDFTVYPNASGCFAKDTNRKMLYFASPKAGTYTLIFFGIVDGKPVITTKDFTVGEIQPEPQPEPQPSPIVTELTETEKTALKTAADAVVRGIQDGTVRQPNHARMEFKRIATQQLGGKVSDEVQAFLKRWTDENAVTTLDDLKATFTKMLEELK